MFVHPDPYTRLPMFDYDDLSDDSLCVLCRLNGEFLKILIWKGLEFQETEEVTLDFCDY